VALLGQLVNSRHAVYHDCVRSVVRGLPVHRASALPLRSAAAASPGVTRARKGASRSRGRGKTIVEFWSDPISSSVWR
jgi:hypothetical protein